MRALVRSVVAFAVVLAPCVASAAERDEGVRGDAPSNPAIDEYLRPGFGARVGGYGFRTPSTGKWDDCRMNGLGVFGTLDLEKHFFGEAAVDFYQADPSVAATGMDRHSVTSTIAVGARMFPDFVVTPFVQLGGGAEWTHLTVPHATIEGIYAAVFLGFGAEVNVTDHVKGGLAIRIHELAALDRDENVKGGVALLSPTPTMSYQTAAQGQIFFRYAL